MINIKKLILIILFLLPISISSFYKKATFFKPTIIVHIKEQNLNLDLEDYIIGVVSAEMPALFNNEALKAQAVASRSYAVSSIKNNIINISNTTSNQVYLTNYELKEKWNNNYDKYLNKIALAVNETKDLVVKREDKILKTYYFSMSNGKTENSKTVFGDNTFKSVSSIQEQNLDNFIVTKTIDLNEFLKVLNIDNINIKNIIRNETNRVDSIEINNKTYTGIEFRKLFNLRSTDFDIDIKNNEVIIKTKGYGHGVGMSQYGANIMAKNGFNYKEIINYYYQDTVIKKI